MTGYLSAGVLEAGPDPVYRLVRAGSADQALLALIVEEFALLILDIRMPGMTCFELANRIKERKKTARVSACSKIDPGPRPRSGVRRTKGESGSPQRRKGKILPVGNTRHTFGADENVLPSRKSCSWCGSVLEHAEVVDAATNAFKLDETLWPQLVTSISHMDVLHSGRLNPGHHVEGAQIRSMVEFARRNYQSVCVDLSGNMENYSIEIMQESKRVYLVTTFEIASLHLARERFHYLRQLDLGDRIQLVLNRSQKRAPISVSQIEDLLGRPVLASIPNDYQSVGRALTVGTPVDSNTDLGREFQSLAAAMMERKPVKADPKAGKWISDYLSILPGKSILFADKKNG